ncbi:TIM-barrel domain-containing protein [uncultured Clostridium sp.]|uniref:TIM-barrel domain-containing protein n=1 Tax=uncultured Clostridium sp. TaxID=59620 RepID=UPI0028E9C9BE|nr:TIM-barrel domain-containing protein [uncultured Clostridium sp.]
MKVFKITENVARYTFGKPIDTEAIGLSGEECVENSLEFLKVKYNQELELDYDMNVQDVVWGLGENQRGMNKKGGIYEAFCSDDPRHTPDKKSLYGAHNFIVIDGDNKFGVFIDYPGKVTFDIGFSNKNKLKITIEESNVDVYIIKGKSSKDIVREFLGIIGESYVPPKWAFGYQQSRWGYKDSKEIAEIADKFIENKIPCDAICLDIDYMERFKDFTIDKDAFPNFKGFVKEIKEKGFRLIPIIDAGVKIEKGYEIYEEGIENKCFCVDDKGEPFIAAVWPGVCHFPDFLNSKAREWFGLKYKSLTDLGIEGFWNDMNEPAIFYTPRGLKEAVEAAKTSEKENLDIHSFFALQDAFSKMPNNITDYKSFYHNMDGDVVNHYKVHNLYGYNMTRSAGEAFRKINPNKRFLLFSRASYIGMHRYGGIWTGDNHSWWEHILLNIKMMPSLNMCGFFYIGADTGGFGGDANEQLVIRWNQFSIFTPLFRNHSAMGTRYQEPYSFGEDTKEIIKKAIEFRYALIPYIYSEYMKAINSRNMYFMPISFEYNDEMSRRIESQLLLGESLMIAPIYEENAVGRYVYLPEDILLWKVRNYRNRQYEVIKKGHTYLDVDFDEIPLFIRKNKILILGKSSHNVESLDSTELNVIAFVESEANYIYYDDDGNSYDFKEGKYSEIIICIRKNNEDYEIEVENKGNKLVKKISFDIVDVDGNIIKKIIYL